MIAEMKTKLFLRGRKLNVSLVSTQIVSNHLFNIEFKEFKKLCKGYAKDLFSFLVDDTNLLSDNPLIFRKKLLTNVF